MKQEFDGGVEDTHEEHGDANIGVLGWEVRNVTCDAGIKIRGGDASAEGRWSAVDDRAGARPSGSAACELCFAADALPKSVGNDSRQLDCCVDGAVVACDCVFVGPTEAEDAASSGIT